MKIKSCIAILLVTIFMVKFVAVDSKWLALLFNGSTISFVNPHCKRENPPKLVKDTPQIGHSSVQVINLDGYCTALFQFEMYTWESNVSEPIAMASEHFTIIGNFPYLESAYPPPRVL